MEKYIYFRILFWFALVFGMAYLFLIIDLGIRISNRINAASPHRIARLLKEFVLRRSRKGKVVTKLNNSIIE
jgi:hypothetical protein